MLNFFFKLIESTPDLIQSAYQIVLLNNVKITKTSLRKEIEEHPDYPSLLSVSDVFNSYGMPNMTVKVAGESLDELPTPFITKLEKNNSSFFTVVKQIADNVEYFDNEKNRWVQVRRSQFLEQFTGISLLVEAEDEAGEPNFEILRRSEKTANLLKYLTLAAIPVFFILFATLTFVQIGLAGLLPVGFSVFTLIGSVISTLLLWYEIDIYNPILKQICSAGKKKMNCNAVIQSGGSKIWGVSWSAIGFSYFFGALICLIAGGFTNMEILSILSVISFCALPYIFYSIYFQWKIAKQWCILCLSVQAVLAAQGLFSLASGWYKLIFHQGIPFSMLLQMFLAYLFSFIVVSLIMPAFLNLKKSKSVFTELQRLKHNPQIFDALLIKQKTTTSTPTELGIKLGNPDGNIKIIKVCSPYCGPCARAHKPLEDLIENNPDVQLQVIFTATSAPNDAARLPVSHLLAIANRDDEAEIKTAMDDWYFMKNKDYGIFLNKHPLTGKLEDQNSKIDAMNTWCQDNHIQFTPTIFINGNQLPEMYSIADLKYFLSAG